MPTNIKRKYLISLVILLVIFLVSLLLYFLYSKKVQTVDLWGEYQEVYEYRLSEDDSSFTVNAYVADYEIIQEANESVALELLVFNQSIDENVRSSLSIPIERSNVSTLGVDNIKRGQILSVKFLKDTTKEISFEFQILDMAEKKNEYLWSLFQILEDSVSDYTEDEHFDPIITYSVKELLLKDNQLSEDQKDSINNYLKTVEKRKFVHAELFAPCYTSNNFNTPYVFTKLYYPNPLSLKEVSPLVVNSGLFLDSVNYNLPVEDDLRLLADRIMYCDVDVSESVKEYEEIVKSLYTYENIGREVINWERTVVSLLNERGYEVVLAESFDDYLLKENFFNLTANSFFRSCILVSCDKDQVLNKVAMYLRYDENNKPYLTKGDVNLDLHIALTLLSILKNE